MAWSDQKPTGPGQPGPASNPRTPAAFSGFGWVVLALASGVALIVAVVVNLQSVVEQRDEQALWVSQRTEQLGARELRRAILDPTFLEQTPESQGFEWRAGKLVIPEAMGWLIPETVGADGGLDALARDLVRRASRATGGEATALWQRALRDPGVHSSARDRLRMQAAWFAHRQGQAEWRDSLLGEIEGTAPPEVRASRLLLLAARDKALPADALQVFGHLNPERAQSLALRLADHGLAFDQGVVWSKEQAERRRRWVQLLPLEARFTSGSEPTWSVLPSGILAVLFPDQSRGVWLERADLIRWASEHVDVPVQLVSSLEPTKVGQRAPASVIPEFVGASLPLQAEDSPTSGPVLLAALVVALAALCGGGAWLALRAAGKEAQAARLKGEFLTTVTHELKTPLAGIRLVAELLADDHVQDPEKRKNYLQALSAESTRLSMLIENVLDLRRMERGERVHDAQLEDLGALVRATVELFEPLLKRSGNRVHCVGLEEPTEVMVDRDDLRQAFLNLLDNARKYGGGGDIHVQLIRSEGRALLRLTDGGPGIEASEREAIFGRFVRGKEHQHGGIPGVGIGLNLARAILRRQGGDLIACDPPAGGSGACFELSLPLQPRTSTESGAIAL